jgi:succinate dehydrogenase subunit C
VTAEPTAASPAARPAAEPGAGHQPLYQPKVSRLWWLRRRSYTLFVLRELSSLFVGWFVVFLLLLIQAVGQGEADYQRFLDWAANPLVLLLNLVALAFVTLHAVTWFNLAPKAMVVKVRGQRVPPRMIAMSQFGGWAFVSLVLAVVLVGLL